MLFRSAVKKRFSQLELELQKQRMIPPPDCPSLLIGDDLLRNIDENKLVRTTVETISNAKITDVAERLRDEHLLNENLKNVFICVGTNDCASKDLNIDEAIISYKNMLKSIQDKVEKPDNIIVSSVPPRKDKKEHQDRVEALNAALTTAAADTGATFVSHDQNFKLVDGEINDGYLLMSDGLHLSRQGTNRLLKNLKVPISKDHLKDATKSPKKNISKANSKRQQAARSSESDSDGPQVREFDQTSWSTVNRKTSTNRSQNNSRRYQQRSQPYGFSAREKRCKNCYEDNHTTVECGFRRPIECRQCYNLGHKQKHCTVVHSH